MLTGKGAFGGDDVHETQRGSASHTEGVMNCRAAALVLIGFTIGAMTSVIVAAVQQPGRAADPTIASPEHYKLEFENDYVRITRAHYGPHEKGALHSHPEPGGVVVHLTNERARQMLPDGTTREIRYDAGAAHWSPPTVHQEENLADQPFDNIRVDVKRCTP